MKKIFSFLAAVLFAGSMMAADATMAAGTNGSDATVNGIAAIKCGTSKATGDMTITVGAGATSLTFYAAGWNNAASTLSITAPDGVTITPASVDLTADAGISNNTPFTVATDLETFKHQFTISGATEGATFTLTAPKRFVVWSATYETGEGGETPVEPGDEPSVLQAVSDSTTWDFSKITANTENALYGNDGIHLTDESTPSKNDEVIYADYTEDFMTFAEDFNKAAIAFKGEYPIRKNKYCQAGTLHFKADVAGTIVVKFSDTGSSASATAVKRYLVVNGEQTEYWTSRENNGEAPYDAQLNVVSEKIAVPAGDVTITGSSAIVVYYVTFVPAQAEEPVLADPTNCAEAAEAALSVSANNELYNNGAVYTIEGYVTSIKTAYNDQYHNISFWMADAADGGEVLQAYRAACASEADAPQVGDKVQVTGSLTKYNTTPEFAAGCTYVITEPYIPVEPEINYYVAGSMGVWGPDEAYRLTPSNNGEYEGEFTFAANDEFKVIGYDGTTVTWFPEGMNNNYVITEAGDYKITFNPAGNVEGWYAGYYNVVKKEEPVVVPADTLTCAAAAELALAGNTEEKIIKGYVTEIVEAWSSFKNVSFWMADAADGGQVFEAFRVNCETEAEAPIVGDLVWVKGNLTAYTKNGVTIAETTKGGSFGIIEAVERPVVEPAVNLGAKTIAEFLELKNTKDTCILTGVVSNIVNTTYGNFDLTDESGKVYVYGLLTPEGESKKFADLNVAEKDTLTVLAIYNEYNGNPQAKNVIFVEVKKAAVEPGETIELAFNDGGVDNYYYEQYRSTDIQLYNIPVVGGQLQGDGDFLQLEVYPADPNDISGEYSIEDEGLDDYYTYLMHIEGTDTTEIAFVAGSITVSVQNPDKETSSADLTVQGQLMTAEGDIYVINSTLNVYYNFVLTEEEKYQNDEVEADFNYNFDTYQLGALNEVVVGVMAQTDEAGIALAIILPQGQTELTAGTYEISDTPMYGTVMAGKNTEMGMSPSYAMTADQKLWFLVSGTVTLNEDGSIVVDALNSNGKAIKSTLNHLRGEGIDEVNAAAKATKSLKNGQLIIEKAGVKYNAQGAVIR